MQRRVKTGHTSLQPKVDKLYSRMGTRVRRTALRLQGLMVKVGQFLSARTDILPTSFTRELKSLQDAVPGVPFERIRRVVESELGSSLKSNFSSFQEEPIAAASLGQVHLATLTQGGRVAVKVLRPGIERLAAIDLRALRVVTRTLERFTRVGRRVQAVALYREFAATVREELDYRQEVEHLLRFSRQFADRSDVVVPRSFSAYSTRRVLVMEYIEGIKVNDLAALEAAGIDADRIVDLVIDTYLEQILEHGFVHADPHPGNLLVLQDGRLCYLDFGMMTDIPRTESISFARLLLAAMVRDIDTVVQCIDQLGFLQPHADKVFLKRAIGFMLDRVNGIELKQGPELDEFLEEFQAFLRDEPLILQAKYMFLGRAIGMVLGLVNTLNPNIQWLPLLRERALPKLTRIVEEATRANGATGEAKWLNRFTRLVGDVFGEAAATTVRVGVGQLQSALTASVRLPQELERVLNKVERNDLEIRLELSEVLYHLAKQERRMSRMTAFGAAAVLVPLGFYLRYAGIPGMSNFAWEAWGLSALAFLRWLWALRPVRAAGSRSDRRRTMHRRHGGRG
ncbi:MAG: phosphotransferase [Alicyclobacillus sp.]|nr:phosphotransferase [Alicyclobacillus sp.]